MRFNKRFGLLLPILAACLCAEAQTTVDFNGVTSLSTAQILNGYAGLNWSNFYVASPALLGSPYNTSGFENGLIDGQYVGFNGYANPSEILTTNGAATLTGLRGYFTAAWAPDDTLTIEGLVNSQVVQSIKISLSEATPKLVKIGFAQDVSEIAFITCSPSTYSAQTVMDDLTINPAATPEPTTLAALGLGLTGMAKIFRRRTGPV